MRKLFSLLFFIGFCQFVFAQTNWYYSIKGEKKTLVAVDSLVVSNGRFCKSDAIQKLSAEKRNSNAKTRSTVFATSTGDLRGLTNQVIFKVKYGVSATDLMKSLSINYTNIKIQNYGFCEITVSENSDVFAISQKIYESGLVDFANPNFISKVKLHSYSYEQWGINNTGQGTGYEPGIDANVLNAWRITKGDTAVKIAVLDSGVKLDHEDLQNNILPGINVCDSISEGAVVPPNGDCLLGEPHGTRCAGIIAAEDNNRGITGVAPKCKIIPIRMLDGGFTTESAKINGLIFADSVGADVISCSWGDDTDNETTDGTVGILIDSISAHGRNGKGAIVVFSSGNDNHPRVNYLSGLPSTICVGAISPTGLIWFQDDTHASNYGAELNLVAPGHNIKTTSVQKISTYEGLDIYDMDSGSSMAAPFVSGIAALLLSVNPDLTVQQVKHALFSTCKKLSNYTYTTVSGKPHGTWEEKTGYGLVNAYNAILSIAPQNLEIIGPDIVESTTQTFSVANLPPGLNVDWEITGTSFLRLGSTSSSILVTNYALTRQNSFNATIKATVHLNYCSSIELTKEVYFLYSGLQSSNDNLYGSFTSTEGQCWLDPIPYNADDFQWSIDNGWMVEGGNGDGSCYFYTRSGFPYSGLATVTVEYKDASGNPSSISKQFHIDMGDEYEYCIYPNPATSTIQITSSSAIKKALENGGDKEIRAYEIFSNTGLQVAKRIYTEKVNETTIDISTLKPGNYYLRIYDGKKWHGQPLIVDKK